MPSDQLDQLDLKILEELRKDARRSNVDIAKTVGTVEGTVRRRIAKLLESGTGKIIMAVDRAKLGFGIEVLIFLKVDLDKAESIANELAQCPEISYVGLMAGDYDIQLHAHFKSNDEVLSLIQGKIAHLEGVRSSETLHVLKVVKRSYSWIPTEA